MDMAVSSVLPGQWPAVCHDIVESHRARRSISVMGRDSSDPGIMNNFTGGIGIEIGTDQ